MQAFPHLASPAFGAALAIVHIRWTEGKGAEIVDD